MSTILQEKKDKIKSFVADDRLYASLLIITVGIVAFGLGRTTVVSEVHRPQIELRTADDDRKSMSDTSSTSASYIASKNGTRYYPQTCPAASRIHEENKIYFTSKEQARAAGFTKTSQCD